MGVVWMRIVKNYSFDHSTGHFRISKGGKHFACCKRKEQAEEMVRLFKECDWDYSRKDEIKNKVISE